MSRRALLIVTAAIALAAPSVAAGQSGAQSTPLRFRSSTEVVSVTAVVRDRKGRFVRDLGRNDFVVAEAGQSKPILDFRAESDGPVKLALLFDVSGSMRVGSKLVDAQETARHLLSALRPDDEAALFSFDTRLQRVFEFTSDKQALEAALKNVEPPFGQTSLYDAVAEMSRTVGDERREGEDRLAQRRAVVVLTDGIDTRSRLRAEQVSAIASGIDVPVYVVAVMSPIDAMQRSEETDPDDSALRNLARWTGGELFIAAVPAQASVTARQIVDELRHQYVLAFEASPRPGWRPLEVRARNRDLVVRARTGYTAGGSSRPSVMWTPGRLPSPVGAFPAVPPAVTQ